MPIYFKTTTDNDANVNKVFSGMPFVCLGEFTLRDGSQYLDVRTNIGNNQMLSVWYWGYLYGRGNCFGFYGGYPYDNTSVLNSHISNMVSTTSNAAAQTILTSVYRATSANSYGTCFKFDSKSTAYTEGKINIFVNNHTGPSASWAVTAYVQSNISGNYY
jgi:hypothetical protein